jgi:hypothetical protein
LKHIEEGNDVNSEGFEYVVSASGRQKAKQRSSLSLSGKPYELNTQDGLFKIKIVKD